VHIALSLSLGFAAQNPISHYWHKITDLRSEACTTPMLRPRDDDPYFIVLLVLAVYGLTLLVVYDYFVYSKNIPLLRAGYKLARVTVQLPSSTTLRH